ncbi:Pentatricopeptide repeat-containing protein [Forsythia ovata]|uniref:Pentatricopeptide repeat-containing protein n=1 Tax=Forsythia ovata TaxID=205694 RepID=A0ABD1TR38_9LAMI
MESIVLPCKTIPPKIPEISHRPTKPKISFKNAPPKPDSKVDAHLKNLCKNGRLSEAIASLDSITQCGSTVRPSTLSHLIDSCIDSNSLDLCYKLHGYVRKLLKDSDPFVETKLVSMYAKCGSLENAFEVFGEMNERNLYVWSAIIGACSRERKWGEVVKLFYSMMGGDNIVPDDFLFPKILQACGNCRDVETGRLIHGIVTKCRMNSQVRVNNSILSVYSKCGWLNSAKRFFEGMEVRDTVSWNTIITGYCQEGEIKEARRLFDLMHEEGVEPGVVTWNILISSYNRLGKCDIAMEIMKEMENCGIMPDVFTWTSVISGFAQNNRRLEALELFREMLLSGVGPNEVTLMSAISACASLKDLRKGREIHLVAMKVGYGEDVLVGNSLVDLYSKCGKLESARQVFDIISEKDVYTWNSMIGGYCQAGYYGEAHDLFMKMQESDVLPNVITWNVMITGYIQSGDEDQAMDLFQRMEKDGGIKRDTASWNAFIAGYLQHGQKDKALGIFRQMQSFGVKPNSVTILSILPACANLIAVNKVKEIHGYALRSNLESELAVANSLIDTYSKSGNIIYSKAMFNEMSTKDIITWNTMIAGYVMHGCPCDAIQLFEQMGKEGYRPNRGTLASMISAYGQAKFVDEGRRLFFSMPEYYHVLPCLDHYAAMVNLLGRSGKLDEAFKFIKDMAMEPDVSIWSGLLTACCTHGNVKLAVYAGERLLELEPENALIHRLVLQLYDLSGISQESLKMKRSGKRNCPKEYLGYSWIEDRNIVHSFVSGGHHQLYDKFLLSYIRSIEVKTKAPKYSDRLRIHEEEMEEIGGVHSEKLALAFALIRSPQTPRRIRIIKNLRTCEHCHMVAKLVSKTHGDRFLKCNGCASSESELRECYFFLLPPLMSMLKESGIIETADKEIINGKVKGHHSEIRRSHRGTATATAAAAHPATTPPPPPVISPPSSAVPPLLPPPVPPSSAPQPTAVASEVLSTVSILTQVTSQGEFDEDTGSDHGTESQSNSESKDSLRKSPQTEHLEEEQ